MTQVTLGCWTRALTSAMHRHIEYPDVRIRPQTGVPEVKNVNKIKSALVVVGGTIAAAPASALELGEIRIHSSLGQPLRASISYTLGPNEALSDN